MGQVERDPFPELRPGRYGNINQFQDPGLDDETRELAIVAVRKAVKDACRTDVFSIDRELRAIERSWSKREAPLGVVAHMRRLMEDMLGRGDEMGNFING